MTERGSFGFPIFDAHCDTIMAVVDRGVDLLDPGADTHITAPGLRSAGYGCQVFACFASRMQFGDDTPTRSREMLAAARALGGLGPLRLVTSVEELDACASADDRVGMLLAVEGGEALGGRVEAVAELAALGVRYITLVWGDNDLGGSSMGHNSGLTGFGKEVVAEMERRRVLVDVSHLSDAGFDDVQRIATRPFVASHSNCRALCDARRNLTDDQVRAIALCGGVVGVNFATGLLTNEAAQAQHPVFVECFSEEALAAHGFDDAMERAARQIGRQARPPLAAVADQIDRIVELGGVDAAAFGSDLDGVFALPAGLDNASHMPALVELLRQRGYSDGDLRKICWENWHRLFSTTL